MTKPDIVQLISSFEKELRHPSCLAVNHVAVEDYVASLCKKMDEAHEKDQRNIKTASGRIKMTYEVESNRVWLYPKRL